jgi:hypothetical protein
MVKALKEENGIMNENRNQGNRKSPMSMIAASVAAKETYRSEASSQLLSSQSS